MVASRATLAGFLFYAAANGKSQGLGLCRIRSTRSCRGVSLSGARRVTSPGMLRIDARWSRRKRKPGKKDYATSVIREAPFGAGSEALRAASNIAFLIGLVRWRSAPASRLRRMSSSRAEAVSAMIRCRGKRADVSNCRIAPIASSPPITGICMSISTM